VYNVLPRLFSPPALEIGFPIETGFFASKRIEPGEFADDPGNAKFGWAVASVGDINGDGSMDVAVGAPLDSMTYFGDTKISSTSGDLMGRMGDADRFGFALAGVGDLNGDDIPDLAVGAPGDDEQGVVWILFLRLDGSVMSHLKVFPRY